MSTKLDVKTDRASVEPITLALRSGSTYVAMRHCGKAADVLDALLDERDAAIKRAENTVVAMNELSKLSVGIVDENARLNRALSESQSQADALRAATKAVLLEMFRDPLGLPTGDPKLCAHDIEQRILTYTGIDTANGGLKPKEGV